MTILTPVVLFFVLICRRLTELASALEDTFQPVVQTHLYPRSQIDIYVQVLQQDGGEQISSYYHILSTSC